MKRILCAVLAAVLLTGCGIKQDEKRIPADSAQAAWDTPLMQTLLDGISSFSTEIRLPARQKNELTEAFWKLLCVHPELFYKRGVSLRRIGRYADFFARLYDDGDRGRRLYAKA